MASVYGGWETRIFVLLGVSAIIYSLFTDYELGAVRASPPFRVHLGIDFASGILLLLSPYLFGFAGQIRLPHGSSACWKSAWY